MIKNPKPRNIAFFTSIIITIWSEFLMAFTQLSIGQMLWLGLGIFVFTFFLFLYALQVFIYRKIKLVYKYIHRQKTSKENPVTIPELISHDPINDVRKEVMDWSRDKGKEIKKLHEMEQFRKDFLGNVSHELKTPIFNIQGYLHTLIDGAMEDPELTMHFLTKAAKSADRLENLVEDLLNISQLESGTLKLQKETFDIHHLIKEVFNQHELMATEKEIVLEFKDGCDMIFMVEADKDKIGVVLANLILNSIKYGREKGRTDVGLYDMDDLIFVEVTDNGIGVEKQHVARLFERFYRIDKGRSRQDGGTGLGLAIVKHIIDAHEQTINVRSKPNSGSSFGFTLLKSK
ncbi:MAG: two-component system phosphate regulon sensor histidine kinase PhoR [Sphingobacteriales bacterium]|jgi:two-component system phosphate regulon sensor histidine kinase PhoR